MGKLLSPVLAELDHADYYPAPVYAHWCGACLELHSFSCKQAQPNGARWTFDDDVDKPTFSPSMNIKIGPTPSGVMFICHYTITHGVVSFHRDSTHALAGFIVPLMHIPRGRLQFIQMCQATRGDLKPDTGTVAGNGTQH